jgi:beta-xylosidase
MFRDNDNSYFLYYATYPQLKIYVQEMVSPFRKKDTPPIKLLEPAAPWEKKHIQVTEAPWLLKHNDVYYLIYSGGGSNSMDYAIGYATSGSPTGPFTKYPGNPIIKKGSGVFGPGHASVITDNKGNLWMLYHQKENTQRNWMRFIALDPLRIDDAGVLHGKATRATEQSAPVTGAQGN